MTFTTRVRLKKTSPVKEYAFETRTTGLDLFTGSPGPYPFRVLVQKGETFVGTDRMKARQVLIDVSSVPVGSASSTCASVSTFWNSLQTEQEQWFGIIGHEKAFKVSQILLFPPGKPFKSFALNHSRTIREPPEPYRGPRILASDPGKTWLYWEVPKPESGCVYRLHWKW